MKIGVVTAFYTESDSLLRRCVDSVRRQGPDVCHYMVGDGRHVEWLDRESGVVQLPLGRANRDTGDTPRAFGAVLAIKDGCDAVAFLDADNYYLPGHLAGLAEASRATGADVVTSRRLFIRPDGSRIEGLQDEAAAQHTDTSCYLLTGRALPLAMSWGLWPRRLSFLGDRILRVILRSAKLKFVHVPLATVAYTTTYVEHYASRGEAPPPGAKSGRDLEAEADLPGWWRSLADTDRHRIRTLLGIADFEL